MPPPSHSALDIGWALSVLAPRRHQNQRLEVGVDRSSSLRSIQPTAQPPLIRRSQFHRSVQSIFQSANRKVLTPSLLSIKNVRESDCVPPRHSILSQLNRSCTDVYCCSVCCLPEQVVVDATSRLPTTVRAGTRTFNRFFITPSSHLALTVLYCIVNRTQTKRLQQRLTATCSIVHE